MRAFRHRAAPTAPGSVPRRPDRGAIDFAWRVHGAQESWSARADVKASILLALEGGGLFAVISAHAADGSLALLSGWNRSLGLVGAGLLLLALVGAAVAVFPQLGRSRKLRERYARHTIYFGHLRLWDPAELSARLTSMSADEELEALGRQLVEMGKQNWSKHRWVQGSLILAISGVLAVSVSALTAL